MEQDTVRDEFEDGSRPRLWAAVANGLYNTFHVLVGLFVVGSCVLWALVLLAALGRRDWGFLLLFAGAPAVAIAWMVWPNRRRPTDPATVPAEQPEGGE